MASSCRGAEGRTHLEGGKRSKRGTPQGGVLSPFLANIYMHRFIKAFRKHRLGEKHGAVLVTYADDLVILCRKDAVGALQTIRGWFESIGLNINEQKTSVKNARRESFDFLGHTFKMLHSYKTGTRYPGVVPSKKAVTRLKDNVRSWLHRGNDKPLPEVIEALNRKLRGWANYFQHGSVLRTRQTLDRFVYDRVRGFLRRSNQVQTRGLRRFPREFVFGELDVVELNALPTSL